MTLNPLQPSVQTMHASSTALAYLEINLSVSWQVKQKSMWKILVNSISIILGGFSLSEKGSEFHFLHALDLIISHSYLTLNTLEHWSLSWISILELFFGLETSSHPFSHHSLIVVFTKDITFLFSFR